MDQRQHMQQITGNPNHGGDCISSEIGFSEYHETRFMMEMQNKSETSAVGERGLKRNQVTLEVREPIHDGESPVMLDPLSRTGAREISPDLVKSTQGINQNNVDLSRILAGVAGLDNRLIEEIRAAMMEVLMRFKSTAEKSRGFISAKIDDEGLVSGRARENRSLGQLPTGEEDMEMVKEDYIQVKGYEH